MRSESCAVSATPKPMPDTTPTSIETLIREFVEKLAASIDSIEKIESSAHTLYNIRTSDSKRLIGPQGEHLRAINMLVRRMAEKRLPDISNDFMVDVNGYHRERIREIEQKAKLLADRVRTFRSSAELSPMNAYERMIVHAMFTDDPEVMTESEGSGPVRHVVLKYRQA